MAIATRCPHCETTYTLKDELGGKRVTCKTCRKVFPVPPAPVKAPAPAKQPILDADQLALAVFADEVRVPEPEPEQIKITVKCQHCDHQNVFEGRMAGKNAPCQNEECRKIIKVPALEKAEAKDWRNVAKRPSMAKVEEGALEGAWGNVQTQAVSREAIVHAEADRIEEAEPVSWGKRIAYGLGALGTLLVLVVGVLWVLRMRSEGKQDDAIKLALGYVTPDPKNKTPKLKKPNSALVHLLAGQYEFAHNNAQEAQVQFEKARNSLDAGANSVEQNASLIEVAAGLAALAGSKPDVDAGSRIDWDKDKKLSGNVRTTLGKLPIQSGEDFRDMRAYAFRRLARVLAEAGKPSAAAPLANALCPDSDKAEILAVIGLELMSMGQREEAEKLAKLASTLSVENAPSLIALWLAIAAPDADADKKKAGNRGALKIAPVPVEKGLLTPIMRVGYSEGWARQGNLDKARIWAAKQGKPEERLRALAAVAGVAVEVRKDDVADLEGCAKLIATEMKNARISPWLLIRLVQLSLRAKKPDLAARFAEAIADPGGQAWARYKVLQAKLESEGKQTADWKLADEVGGPDRLAHWLALAALAQHNAEATGPSSVMSEVKKWDDSQKPFAYAGVALAER